MSKTDYSWWDDPKNQEQVKEISWWNHDENQAFFDLPISLIKEDELWVATTNEKTAVFLGHKLQGCAQGKTKEEAIRRMFALVKMSHEYSDECRLNYQRWVPFRKGDWKHSGGKWFVIFGIHFYFRYGKGMKGGWYIPFSKLNISISSEWTTYKNWKRNNKLSNTHKAEI